MRMYNKVFLSVFMAIISTQALGITFNERINDISKIDSNFEQKIYNETDQVIQESSGFFELDERYGFKWEVSAPYSEEIFFDKSKLYIHDPDLEQVRIDNIDNNDQFLSIFFNNDNFKDNFNEEKIDEDSYLITPIEKQLDMKYFIKFKNETLDEVVMEDGVSQKTVISFDHNNPKKEFKESDFTFELYDNIDVIRSHR